VANEVVTPIYWEDTLSFSHFGLLEVSH